MRRRRRAASFPVMPPFPVYIAKMSRYPLPDNLPNDTILPQVWRLAYWRNRSLFNSLQLFEGLVSRSRRNSGSLLPLMPGDSHGLRKAVRKTAGFRFPTMSSPRRSNGSSGVMTTMGPAVVMMITIRSSYNTAGIECQIHPRYSSSDSILNPFSEAETDDTGLERQ